MPETVNHGRKAGCMFGLRKGPKCFAYLFIEEIFGVDPFVRLKEPAIDIGVLEMLDLSRRDFLLLDNLGGTCVLRFRYLDLILPHEESE